MTIRFSTDRNDDIIFSAVRTEKEWSDGRNEPRNYPRPRKICEVNRVIWGLKFEGDDENR